jgi:hypothetical protein
MANAPEMLWEQQGKQMSPRPFLQEAGSLLCWQTQGR